MSNYYKIDILCCTSNEYAAHAGVMLASLFENNQDIDLNVFIFTTGFSVLNTENLQLLAKRYNQKIEIKNFLVEELGITKIPGNWGVYPYLKLYASDILVNCDRLLYLDTDMIVLKSIKSITQINIDNYYLAMADDCHDGYEHKIRLEIPTDNFFGNSGLIYFNLKKCREDQIWKKCREYINNYEYKIKFADQDVINKVCAGHIYQLDITWNMMAFYYLNKPLIRQEYLPDLKTKKNNAIIIHYTCIKPWYKDCDFPLKSYYLHYLSYTEWKNILSYSPKFKRSYFLIKQFRYFLQYLGLKDYDYLYEYVKKP